MCSELRFVLYMTNWTLSVILHPTVTTILLECTVLALNGNHEAFFYNSVNKTCILQTTKIHTTNDLVQHAGFKYYVKNGPTCGPPPVAVDGNLTSVIKINEDVYTAVYSCKAGHFVDTKTCDGNTWSTENLCKAVTSCSVVKECNPSYTSNGEYWIYPNVFGNKRVKLYCQGMDTDSPKEYLTLSGYNVADHPNYHVSSRNCQLDNTQVAAHGKTEFNKIRINPQTMTVINNDFAFVNNIYGINRAWGMAVCCSVFYTAICQRGYAKSDISSTGLKFSSSNIWIGFGWKPHFTVVSQTDHVVVLNGDGACGGAQSKDAIKFDIDIVNTPPIDSATEPQCI